MVSRMAFGGSRSDAIKQQTSLALLVAFLAVCVVLYFSESFTAPWMVAQVQQRYEACTLKDLTSGEWINISTPLLPGGYEYCTVDPRQDCRSDSGVADYLYKTFVPYKRECAIRDLAAHDIKTCLTNRKVIFIGDSLARNQQQSLQCMTLERPEENIQFFNGYKVAYDSYFPQHNSSIHYVDSSILSNFSETIKHLDMNPRDIIVVGTGPWWQHINLVLVEEEPALSRVSSWDTFPGGSEVAKAFIDSKIRRLLLQIESAIPSETRIIFRSPDLNHFGRGVYDPLTAGSGCLPFESGWDSEDGRIPYETVIWWVHQSVLRHIEKTRIELFDVTRVSGLRPDGHPSAHIHTTKDGRPVEDCLHWCLPGVPDTWNRILLTEICGSGTYQRKLP